MSLPTGTVNPTGTRIVNEDIYIDSGPTIYFQDADAALANNPDSDGFYWNLSGTAANPVFEVGCYDDFQFVDNVTSNPITCQALGQIDELQKRDSVGITFTLKSILPFDMLSRVLRGGSVTQNVGEGTEKFGMGSITSRFWQIFCTKVYDADVGDYVSVTVHRAKFTNGSPLSTPYADAWNIPIEMMGFADRDKPSDQTFATWVRLDPSVIV